MDTRLTRLVGIPWVLGGRDYSGVDCVGLFLLVQKTLFCRDLAGVWIYDGATYAEASRAIPRELERLGFQEVAPPVLDGDAVVVRFGGLFHLGTVVRGRMLHTAEGARSGLTRVPRPGIRVGYYRMVRG